MTGFHHTRIDTFVQNATTNEPIAPASAPLMALAFDALRSGRKPGHGGRLRTAFQNVGSTRR
ncbi:MAG: hypothetical protein R3E86_03905 [Pseudomonadales bacterium]